MPVSIRIIAYTNAPVSAAARMDRGASPWFMSMLPMALGPRWQAAAQPVRALCDAWKRTSSSKVRMAA